MVSKSSIQVQKTGQRKVDDGAFPKQPGELLRRYKMRTIDHISY